MTNDRSITLLDRLRLVRDELTTLNRRAAGLGYTPKGLREARMEEFKAAFEAKRKEEQDLMDQLRSLNPS